jgi:hypothetical protein
LFDRLKIGDVVHAHGYKAKIDWIDKKELVCGGSIAWSNFTQTQKGQDKPPNEKDFK